MGQFLIENAVFKSILEKKHQNFLLWCHSFLCRTWNVYWSVPISRNLPAPKKSWLRTWVFNLKRTVCIMKCKTELSLIKACSSKLETNLLKWKFFWLTEFSKCENCRWSFEIREFIGSIRGDRCIIENSRNIQ